MARVAEARGSLRASRCDEHLDVHRPGRIKQGWLTVDIPDLDAVMAMMQTQEGADAMAHDGVHPDSMVILVAS